MENLSWSIGSVRVTRVLEREVPLPLTSLLPDATPEALARHASWLRPHFIDDSGRSRLSIHALVVESSGRRILVDTCAADKEVPGWERLFATASALLENLAAAGFARESIDTVLCTHMHFDHVGWNTIKERGRFVPTFPNARYLFARREWEHWTAENNEAFTPTLADAVRPIVDAGRADLVEMDHRLNDEVWLEPTPGHTPGHVAVRIASQGEQAMITGDLIHHPVQWAEPRWRMPADSDPAQAIRTRERLIAEHGDTPLLVIGTHYPAPTAGRIVRGEAGAWFRAGG